MSFVSIRSHLLLAGVALLLAAACARSTDSKGPAASSQEVAIAPTPAYSAPSEQPAGEITAARIDEATSTELARRERDRSHSLDGSRASSGRVSIATPGALATQGAAPRQAEDSAPTPDRRMTTDRFRAIPVDAAPAQIAPTSEPILERPVERKRTETFREVSLIVPAGTRLEAELEDDLSSQANHVGDSFTARLVSPVSVEGYFAFPVGAEIVGHVEEVERARRLGGKARLLLVFDHLKLPEGEVPLEASLYDEARGEGSRDAAAIGGATVAGAILGRAIGDDHRARGSALGALIGAVIGTGVAASRQGEAIEIPSGAALELVLDEPAPVTIRVRVLEVS